MRGKLFKNNLLCVCSISLVMAVVSSNIFDAKNLPKTPPNISKEVQKDNKENKDIKEGFQTNYDFKTVKLKHEQKDTSLPVNQTSQFVADKYTGIVTRSLSFCRVPGGDVICSISKGTQVQVLGSQGSLLKIVYKDREGWVDKRNVIKYVPPITVPNQVVHNKTVGQSNKDKQHSSVSNVLNVDEVKDSIIKPNTEVEADKDKDSTTKPTTETDKDLTTEPNTDKDSITEPNTDTDKKPDTKPNIDTDLPETGIEQVVIINPSKDNTTANITLVEKDNKQWELKNSFTGELLNDKNKQLKSDTTLTLDVLKIYGTGLNPGTKYPYEQTPSEHTSDKYAIEVGSVKEKLYIQGSDGVNGNRLVISNAQVIELIKWLDKSKEPKIIILKN